MANDVELSVTADVQQAKQGLKEVSAEVANLGPTAKSSAEGVATLSERLRALGFDEEFIALQERVSKGIRDIGESAEETAGKLGGGGKDGGDGLEGKFAGTAVAAGKVFAAVQAVGSIFESAATLLGRFVAAEGEAGEETRAVASELGQLGKSITSLDVMGTAVHLGGTLAAAWIDLTDATISLADANSSLSKEQKAQVEALRAQLKAAADIVAQHKESKEAADTEAGALVRLIAQQKASGEVQKWVKDRVHDLLDEYDDLGEKAPDSILSAAAALGVLSSAQEKAAKDSERLAERAEKDAERRAKAEEKAAERVRKALESNSEKINEQIKVYEDAVKRLDEVNNKLAEAQRTDIFGKPVNAANESVDELTRKVADLRSQPIIDFAELARAEDALKDLRLKSRAPFPGQDAGADPNAKLIEERDKAQAASDKEKAKLDKLREQRAQLLGETQSGTKATGDLSKAQDVATASTSGLADESGRLGDTVVAVGGDVGVLTDAWRDYYAQAEETTAITAAAAGSTATLGEEAAGAAVRIETLADGTQKITNVADKMGDVFSKVGDILIEDFGEGQLQIRNTGSAAEYLKKEAEGAATAVEGVAKALDKTEKGEDGAPPLGTVQDGLKKTVEGAKDSAEAVDALNASLTESVRLATQLSELLSGLQLGS